MSTTKTDDQPDQVTIKPTKVNSFAEIKDLLEGDQEKRKLPEATVLHREFRINTERLDEESRSVELAFSSEAPVARWFGNEVLDHAPSSVVMDRLHDGAPLLLDHDPTRQIGVVESARIDADRIGRAVVRFSKGPLGSEILQDVSDGIRSKVSVGYQIKDRDLQPDDNDIVRVMSWMPLELSITSIPADNAVGVGRTAADVLTNPDEEIEMTEKVEKVAVTPEDKAPIYSIDREEARVDTIRKLGDLYGAKEEFVRDFITSDKSPEQFRSAMREAMPAAPESQQRESDIGLTEQETRDFSFVRAINALANPTDRRAQESAAFEFECGQAAAQLQGKESRGIMVPNDVLKRDLVVGTTTAGGHTVSTDLLSQSFIDLLRNRAVVFSRATQLMGLVGNIAIPRQTGGATAYWVAESAAVTESQQAFDQVTMSPETVGAFTDVSRKLLLQSSIDIESFVRTDLATILALELDRVCIEGAGTSNEPEGILNTTGIGSVALGTNGLAPTWDSIVSLETEVAQDNADVGSLAYITNAKFRGVAKRTFIDSGSGERIWDSRAGDTPLNGYQALISNQVPSDLTKGTGTDLSACIFGNLRDLIVGMWGGLDLMVDPYTASTTGTVRVVALQDAQLAVRHPESFAAIVDAITT